MQPSLIERLKKIKPPRWARFGVVSAIFFLWVILTPILPMTVQVSGQDVSALDSCSLVRPARWDLSISS